MLGRTMAGARFVRVRGQRFALLPAVVLLGWIVAGAPLRGQAGASRTLEIEMQISAGATAQLFWSAAGHFTEDQSARIALEQKPGVVQRLAFTFPAAESEWLRFDPTDTPAEIRIVRIRLLDEAGAVIQTIDPATFRPGSQIASVLKQPDGTRIVTAPNGPDPYLILRLDIGDRTVWRRLATVTPAVALGAGAAIALLIGVCVAIVLRGAIAPSPAAGDPGVSHSGGQRALLAFTLLFLIVFTSKLFVMRENPAMTPFWDQWDAEAAALIVPLPDGGVSWQSLIAPHNEHRVFFTRLLALVLLVLNGQWDPRVETAVNAAIHSLTAVILVATFWIAGGRRRLELLAVVCALVFALPGWENILFGFQNAFYFLLLFSVLAIWLTMSSPGTLSWWLGWACAVAALFTAASGIFTALAIALVAALRWPSEPRAWRSMLVNGAAAAAVLLLGWALASPPLQQHAYLKARSAREFGTALARNLAWPWIDLPPMALLAWLPLAALVVRALAARAWPGARERYLIGLAAWVVMSGVALAYGRGAGGSPPAIRYLDFLSVGFLVNAVAVFAIFDSIGTRTTSGRVVVLAGVLWLAQAAVGIDRLSGQMRGSLDGFRPFLAAHTTNIRHFVLTGDIAALTAKRGPAELPHPDQYQLANLLQYPQVRRVLPAAVRPPLRIHPRAVTPGGFVIDGPFAGSIPRDPLRPAWWSLSGEGRRAKGRFESEPTRCETGGSLRFEVAGYLGWERQYLAIRDLERQRDLPIVPPRVAGESWIDVTVPCPSGRFAIVAIDESAESWFGFREPIEVVRGSQAAELLIRYAREALVAALALAIAGLAWRRED